MLVGAAVRDDRNVFETINRQSRLFDECLFGIPKIGVGKAEAKGFIRSEDSASVDLLGAASY